MGDRPKIFVTVGMGPWPFDRLLTAVRPLCDEAEVFAQRGTSRVELPCPSEPFLGPDEVERRLRDADVVITHAGNTVRMAQRMGLVPIAVAREAARGEMGNDHQVAYLRREQERGRVLAVWDVEDLPALVAQHRDLSHHLTQVRSLPRVADPGQLADQLDALVRNLTARPRSVPGWAAPADQPCSPTGGGRNPFERHPLRRYWFAWERVAGLDGPHLDIGLGLGDFAAPLASGTGREVHGVDVHAGYVRAVREAHPQVQAQQLRAGDELPYATASFASVTLLDVVEHAPDESAVMREARRVLRPGGTAVITVPRRHAFSWLDPDNAKYRWPGLHRLAYTGRFGSTAYRERFVDTQDGLRGDMAVERDRHTNYRTQDLLDLVRGAGLEVVEVAGANFFWRLLQIPGLFLSGRWKSAVGAAIALDGRLFRSPQIAANLFVVARRPL